MATAKQQGATPAAGDGGARQEETYLQQQARLEEEQADKAEQRRKKAAARSARRSGSQAASLQQRKVDNTRAAAELRRMDDERLGPRPGRRAQNKARYRQTQQEANLAAKEKPMVTTAEFAGSDGEVYTDELGAKLYELVATGYSMDEISAMPGMPRLYTILKWATSKDHPFGPLYEEAKQRMTLLMEERAVLVASRPMVGEVKITKQNYDFKTGEVVETTETRLGDNVERARLYSDAIRWRLGILQPKRYGRNADGDSGKPNEQLKALFESLKAGPVG